MNVGAFYTINLFNVCCRLVHPPDLMSLLGSLHGEKCPHSDWFDFVWGFSLLPLLLQGRLAGILINKNKLFPKILRMFTFIGLLSFLLPF